MFPLCSRNICFSRCNALARGVKVPGCATQTRAKSCSAYNIKESSLYQGLRYKRVNFPTFNRNSRHGKPRKKIRKGQRQAQIAGARSMSRQELRQERDFDKMLSCLCPCQPALYVPAIPSRAQQNLLAERWLVLSPSHFLIRWPVLDAV